MIGATGIRRSEKKRYKTERNPGEAIYPRTQKHFHYNVARLTVVHQPKKKVFEVDVDPQLAFEFLHGKELDMRDVLKVQRIFHDVSTAQFAKNEDLKEVFGTEDPLEVAAIIIKKGKVQPSLVEEKRLREEKKERIISMLLTCAVHEKTQKPLTHEDGEKMITDAKVTIDLHEPDSWLFQKITEHAHMKCTMQTVQLTFAPKFIGAAKYHLTQVAKIIKEEILADGGWQVTADLPIGIKEELFTYLNGLTHGKFGSKLISR